MVMFLCNGIAIYIHYPFESALIFSFKNNKFYLMKSLKSAAITINLLTSICAVSDWIQVPQAGTKQIAFNLAGTVFPQTNEMIVFGGYTTFALQSTWMFNFTTLTWTKLLPSVKPAARVLIGNALDPRYGHFYAFGGDDGGTHFHILITFKYFSFHFWRFMEIQLSILKLDKDFKCRSAGQNR